MLVKGAAANVKDDPGNLATQDQYILGFVMTWKAFISSLCPGGCGFDFYYTMFKHVVVMTFLSIWSVIAFNSSPPSAAYMRL